MPTDRNVTWAEHGGRVVRVKHYRCITCASTDLARRDFQRKHEKDKPVPEQALPADGRMFVARPLDEDEEVSE